MEGGKKEGRKRKSNKVEQRAVGRTEKQEE